MHLLKVGDTRTSNTILTKCEKIMNSELAEELPGLKF